MAEREGFEPSVELSPHTRLAGERLQPARPSLLFLVGGGSRIRTHGAVTLNGFQDRRFRPLSHPSKPTALFFTIWGFDGQSICWQAFVHMSHWTDFASERENSNVDSAKFSCILPTFSMEKSPSAQREYPTAAGRRICSKQSGRMGAGNNACRGAENEAKIPDHPGR